MEKIVLMGIFLLLTVIVTAIHVCNPTIRKNSATHIHSTVSDIPYHKAGLLLGTSSKLKSGKVNRAIEYNARDVSAYAGFKTNLRELWARVKVFVDMVTNKIPKHLGEKIKTPE